MIEKEKLEEPFTKDWVSFLKKNRSSCLIFKFDDCELEVRYVGEESPYDTDSGHSFIGHYEVLKDSRPSALPRENSLLQITDDDVREMLSIEVLDESEKD